MSIASLTLAGAVTVLDRPGVADIDHRGRGGTGPVPGPFTSDASGAVTVDVGHHDRVTPGDQRGGQGLPDTRGGPGNDCHPGHRDLDSPWFRCVEQPPAISCADGSATDAPAPVLPGKAWQVGKAAGKPPSPGA
jgi:hypothetical protein